MKVACIKVTDNKVIRLEVRGNIPIDTNEFLYRRVDGKVVGVGWYYDSSIESFYTSSTPDIIEEGENRTNRYKDKLMEEGRLVEALLIKNGRR